MTEGSSPRIIEGGCHCGALRFAADAKVNAYQFGHGTAAFHVCETCGAVPVVTSTIGGRRHAVVNVNCFEGVDPADLQTAPTDFEGEDTDGRLARRQRNWIGKVTLERAPAS